MKRLRLWQPWVVLLLLGMAWLGLPFHSADPLSAVEAGVFILLLLGAAAGLMPVPNWLRIAVLAVAPHAAAWLLIGSLLERPGSANGSFFLVLAAAWLLAWALVTLLAAVRAKGRGLQTFLSVVIPILFGGWILLFWEAATRGLGIPFILLPPPSAIFARLVTSLPVIAADVNQTIFKSVLVGYVAGCTAGFLVAILADRVPFMRRGLLPIGNMVSALPIIGVAPIMVMWFGFDWHSKAAVVVIMTFFPMLVNTVAGLSVTATIERDLMRTYAAGYWQTLAKLRLPSAAPFIFNALKINSTLALIGAIVAEFFGTPVVGMGFRISTEVGRMNVDMVWAEIVVAAIIGSLFYGVIALVERSVTFWHPSFRTGRA